MKRDDGSTGTGTSKTKAGRNPRSEYPTMDSDCSLYRTRFGHLDMISRDLYSGEGQCRGRLVTDGSRIVVCCCARLADSLCFGGAHVHEDRLYRGTERAVRSGDGEGGAYIVPPERTPALRACPFCGAPLLHCRGIATDNYNDADKPREEPAI